ncbi:hypothetical protein IB279_25695 [Ensifer sp. ENS06]|uniref:hypothetical protein n=1 Tax=Ensifer sp. ENS06 TaxID=2769276 RepID=UPI000DE06ED7|nr:hypothetical protein [Ensifer sp. ENS06]MBD9626346.1 hypothetical protein [Ensifer sp. ENS06]
MFKGLILAVAMILSSSHVAAASSDSAWTELFAKANSRCTDQSGMAASIASTPAIFIDAVGKVALLLRGTIGKGKSKQTVDLICLYDVKSEDAAISDYGWLGGSPR